VSWSRKQLAGRTDGPVHAFDVPFQHVDAAGIVFFGRMFEYFHDAYVAALTQAGHPLHVAIAEKRWLAPLVHAEADYVSPLRFGDRVHAQVVAAEATESKLTVGYRVAVDGGDGAGRVAAVGHTVHVFCDMTTLKRAPMPEGIRAFFAAIGS